MTNDTNSAWVYYDKNGNRISRPASLDNHGPTNQPGLTTKEYWEMREMEDMEKNDEYYRYW